MKQILLSAAFVSLLFSSLQAQNRSTNTLSMSGTYTIGGESPDFVTPVAAINELHDNGVSGPVTFLMRAGTYDGQLNIDSIGYSGPDYPIVFTSQYQNADSVIISYGNTDANDNWVVRLNKSQYITFEYLTLKADGGNANMGTIVTATQVFDHVNFEHCVFYGKGFSATPFDAKIGIDTRGIAITDVNLNNCKFENSKYYIYAYTGARINVSNNTFGLNSPYTGDVILNGFSEFNILNNHFKGNLNTYYFSALNANIDKNHVEGNFDIYSSYAAEGGVIYVTNNTVESQFIIRGCADVQVYHNTLLGRFNVRDFCQNIRVANNLIQNMISSWPAIDISNLNQFTLFDYNAVYSAGILYQTAIAGTTTPFNTKSDWLTALSGEGYPAISLNDIERQVLFDGEAPKICPFEQPLIGGDYGISTDYEGDNRSLMPSIGADEFITHTFEIQMSDDTINSGESIMFEVLDFPYYVDWYDASSGFIATNNSLTYTPTGGTQIVAVYGSGDCMESDTVSVAITSVNKPSNISSNINVYPNPAKDLLYIDSNQNNEYQIIDALGRVVLSGTYSSSPISVSQLDNGVYTLVLMVNGQNEVRHWVKM